ncbi:hypothetical protein MYCTH_2130133 [Thermothelomyces thermophilus ATCC 42464]|uniref:DNA/RNA-binding domain-containing protein n=1 Tax=Thermothelomyces thermophilus (strain ATCC 42464 / BCRC 31852 / DSM 1799) TaxID=573729 RepID=G2QM04_THET4|nr:uncharacterized protein MYCTH_2130133 [Thermothelomyces thermophilus ATCC 42464]AEO60984.1 hypothetical protein MYCTH_2130133 [Thermothelomyces thermophilus ATCC 42464]
MWPIVYWQSAPTFDIFRHVHVSVAVATIIVVSIIVICVIARVGKSDAHPRQASWNRSLWALSVSKPHHQSYTPPAGTPAPAPSPADPEPAELIKEPETRPISQEQLVSEVKGIYAGLVVIESKCIEVVKNQTSQNDASGKLINNQSSQTGPLTKLNNDQWQALIALYRTLLHEHHDFLLASQHPSASPALRRLAAKYAMPARMWRHGIHDFLELLRHRLPASLDHMRTFIDTAYSMMALLYEMVPAFEDTWMECLGDLARYHMAIEDDDVRNREVWRAVSRHWYSRASDKAPTTGHLYHHLAILAQPNAQQQLYYYTKSLCVKTPFLSARESIMSLFEPIMSPISNPQQTWLPRVELHYVRTHGILFTGKQEERLQESMDQFLKSIGDHIALSLYRWLEPGYHIGISNICALLGYGDESNPIAQALKTPAAPSRSVSASEQFRNTRKLFNATYDAEEEEKKKNEGAEAGESRPGPPKRRPLPEDFALRGFPFVEKYFPDEWFEENIDYDDKYVKVALTDVESKTEERKERVLWLGCRIAEMEGKWLRFDKEKWQFGVNSEYEVDLDL